MVWPLGQKRRSQPHTFALARNELIWSYYWLMKTFGWTIEEVKKLDFIQIGILLSCIKRDLREQERAARRRRA